MRHCPAARTVCSLVGALIFSVGFSSRAQAVSAGERYWLRVWKTDDLKEAQAIAEQINPDWIEGGRLTQVFIRRRANSESGAGSRFRVYIGVYPNLVQTIRVAIQVLRLQPWQGLGILCPHVQAVLSGKFLPIHIRFSADLAAALRRDGKQTYPRLAQSVVARGFGFPEPAPVVPSLLKATARFSAGQRVLVLSETEKCAETRRLVGGPPPRRAGARKAPKTPQTHRGGKRCLRWLQGLTEQPLTLAWFPAVYLIDSGAVKKARTTSRWGPVTYRYTLNRVGQNPAGVVYHAVFRTGAFAPIIERVVIAHRYPEPHRLSFDRLGAAVYEGKGRIVKRLSIKPPPPRIPPLWRKKKKTKLPVRTYEIKRKKNKK
jgi:hypothetical protein